jgi:fused signal recognition particle receptor
MSTLLVVLGALAVIALVVVAVLVARSRRSTTSLPPSAPAAPLEQPPQAEAEAPVEHPDTSVEEEAPSYRERLGRSRGLFSALRSLGSRHSVDPAALQELEDALLRADVGVATTEHLMSEVRSKATAEQITDVEGLLATLRGELIALLETGPDGTPVDRSLDAVVEEGRVAVWLFVGVNGVGKTTTIGKLSAREVGEGHSVVLAAGDTFRAAAADQLGLWAERTGADLVRGAEGGDPSAVVFDAIQRAGARHADLVLADTAGRLHNKVNLVEELKKIRRVADREPGQVSEVLLVLDATTGQNAVSQAREFLGAVDATGVVLTKLDGTARGGVVVAIQKELGLPVKLVGLGEGAADLVVFDPTEFVDALLAP